MNKVIWGVSQAITSLLFFVVQLSFLKSQDLLLMALFSAMFCLMNFLVLGVRRSLIEIHSFYECRPGIVFNVAMSFIFFFLCLPILFVIRKDFSILFCMTLFLFNQLTLDTWRFSGAKNHKRYIAVQSLSVLITLFFEFISLSPSQILTIITLSQLVFTLLGALNDKRRVLNLRSSFDLFNLTRFLDFMITSGFGFFLPFLTFTFLNANAVGELRTSQNLLSLGNIFTSAFYYPIIMGQDVKKIAKKSYFFPSFLLLALLSVLIVLVPRSFVEHIFGPFFYNAIPLTVLLIIALAPTIWVSTMNAALVNTRHFGFLVRVHLVSLVLLSLGSSAGFIFIGVEAYGFFAALCAILEAYLIKRFYKIHHASLSSNYELRSNPKKIS